MPRSDGPLVLFYNRFFGEEPSLEKLGGAGHCRWSLDRKDFSRADIVVFHIPDLGRIDRLKKREGQVWVAWCMESKVNYPVLADAAFMRRFDFRMTYEQDADVWCPYLPHRNEWDAAIRQPVPGKTEAAPTVLFRSAAVDHSGRTDLLVQLFRYMKIDSYGRFMHTRELDGPDLGNRTKFATIARYRFSLAFENSVAPDYVTEKLFEPLLLGTVPVYLGAPNAAEFMPEHSYVDAGAFPSAKVLAEHLNRLAVDGEAYAAYHRWRSQPLPQALLAKFDRVQRAPVDRLLDLHARRPIRRPGVVRRIASLFGR